MIDLYNTLTEASIQRYCDFSSIKQMPAVDYPQAKYPKVQRVNNYPNLTW